MKTFDRVDLRGLHTSIVDAKGGTFRAVRVTPRRGNQELRRLYERLLPVPLVGSGAQQAVAASRRIKNGLRAR